PPTSLYTLSLHDALPISIRYAGGGVLIGTMVVIVIAAIREFTRLAPFAGGLPTGTTILAYVDPATAIGTMLSLVASMFSLRVALDRKSTRLNSSHVKISY